MELTDVYNMHLNLKCITLKERRQTQKNTYYMSAIFRHSTKGKIIRSENITSCRVWGNFSKG